MIQRINPPSLYDGSRFGMSQGSVDPSGLVFLSGQVAWDVNAQVVGSTYAEQARKALDNLDIALKAAGTDMNHVLHVRLYVRGEIAEHLDDVAPILAERLGPLVPPSPESASPHWRLRTRCWRSRPSPAYARGRRKAERVNVRRSRELHLMS